MPPDVPGDGRLVAGAVAELFHGAECVRRLLLDPAQKALVGPPGGAGGAGAEELPEAAGVDALPEGLVDGPEEQLPLGVVHARHAPAVQMAGQGRVPPLVVAHLAEVEENVAD